MEKIRKNDAVSEIVGIAILLGMTIALFSVVQLIALSFPFVPSAPSAYLIGTTNQNTILIEHCGGESISLDTKIIFTINNITEPSLIARNILNTSTSNGNDLWDIGEKVSYNPGFNITGLHVSVLVIDPASNSIIMMGELQREGTILLITHVNIIVPYNQISSTLVITASGDSRLDSVTLWYRYSSDNSSWNSYSNFNTVTDSPWKWSFNFPHGPGYYEFYSIGSLKGVLEKTPPSADAMCHYGHGPKISNPYPANATVGISLNPTLSITISDIDGDLMTVTWHSNSSGSWQILGTNSSKDGTCQHPNSAFGSYSTTYWWYVTVSDGTNINTSAIFHFTTLGNKPPTIHLINPTNGSIYVIPKPLCKIWVNDTDGDTLAVYWYENSTGNYILRNTNSVSANSTVSYTFTQFTNNNTRYYWKIIVNDSKENNMAWYYFTTGPIKTSVNIISPYTTASSPHNITATGDSALNNVTLWYRWSLYNWSTFSSFYNDTIDSNTCNVDNSTDKGTETNFANAQGIASDGNVMTIQEADQDAGVSTLGKTSGSGSSYTTINANQMYGQVFTATSSGEIYQATFYGRSSSGTCNAKLVICDSSGNILTNGVSSSVSVSTTAGSKTATWATGSRPTVINGNTYWIMVIPDNTIRLYYDSTTGGTSKADTSNSYTTPTNPTDATSGTTNYRVLYADIYNLNYNIDFEYQWTNALYYKTNKTICIDVTSHTGNDNLLVRYRNGSSWSSLGTITGAGWYYFKGVGVTSPTYTIQFIGNTETGDTSQDSWSIDCIYMYSYNYSTIGYNWHAWSNINNPDTISPWSWSFTFPNGTGYYEFYSIGRYGGNTEAAPAVADARCHYNLPFTVNFGASADTYINENSGNSNYGSDTYLRIGYGYTRRGLIQFDLSSLAGKTIDSAELRLYKYDYDGTDPAGRTYNAHRITGGSWTETGVTWNNAPSYNSGDTDSNTVPNNGNWMTWDVKSDVQAFASGTYTNYGWLIKDSAEPTSNACHSYFYSREYTGTTYDPVLVVTYH